MIASDARDQACEEDIHFLCDGIEPGWAVWVD
jgi:hypothetical protein